VSDIRLGQGASQGPGSCISTVRVELCLLLRVKTQQQHSQKHDAAKLETQSHLALSFICMLYENEGVTIFTSIFLL